MQYRKFGRTGIDTSILGFGCMRLPIINSNYKCIDEEEAIKLIRYAADNGVNYFDTAYPYHGGNSEYVLGKALKDGYRERVFIADKNPVWQVKEYEDFERLLDEQLKKLDVEYIDFYLLHALDKERLQKVKDLRGFEFLDKAKKDGKIKYAGFSFHDDHDIFIDVVDSYNWDFCQIQYNYMDIENQAGTKGLKYAYEKGLAVIIMEPLLGGRLANTPPQAISNIWEEALVKRTPAEWGLRWLWNQKEVAVVLSGMSNMEQVVQNIKTAGEGLENSLTEKEGELISRVREEYRALTKVKCTGCEYCQPCPVGVKIPNIFNLYNNSAMYNHYEICSKNYMNMSEDAKATACIECGKCEEVCPQHIDIRNKLKEAHKALYK